LKLCNYNKKYKFAGAKVIMPNEISGKSMSYLSSIPDVIEFADRFTKVVETICNFEHVPVIAVPEE
jgi:hypothetical protein